jgi:ribonuclease HI
LDEVGVSGATNSQMELHAVITAMEAIQDHRFRTDLLEQATKIDIYTDSRYVVDNLNKAMFEWPKTGWMNRGWPPVANADLWKELVRQLVKLSKMKRVEIKWGKGHSANNPHNKVADKLAKESAKRPVRPPLATVAVRRKKTSKTLELGSVTMLGQRLTIPIVTAEYLAGQKVHKYMYEVMSRRSPFYGNVDVAYSEDGLMRAGHTYRVTMNEDANYPQIARCHREVDRAAVATSKKETGAVMKPSRVVLAAVAILVAALSSSSVAASTTRLPGFHSPSGNIKCLYVPGRPTVLRCKIAHADYAQSLQNRCMSRASLDWHGFELNATREGLVTCSGGILYNPNTQRPSYVNLPYGKTWRQGVFTCRSRVSGVTCRNREGHGLFISRQAWRTW